MASPWLIDLLYRRQENHAVRLHNEAREIALLEDLSRVHAARTVHRGSTRPVYQLPVGLYSFRNSSRHHSSPRRFEPSRRRSDDRRPGGDERKPTWSQKGKPTRSQKRRPASSPRRGRSPRRTHLPQPPPPPPRRPVDVHQVQHPFTPKEFKK